MSTRAGVAVITGGSAGVGLALAGRLATRGMHVLLVALDAGHLHAASRGVPASDVLAADVATEEGRARIVEAVHALGRLDLLAHAGRASAPPPESALDPAELARQYETAMLGPIGLTRALWPLLQAHGGSLLAVDGAHAPGGAEAAAHAGLTGWARVLRIQGLREGVATTLLHAAPDALPARCADAALRALDRRRAETWCPPSARLGAIARAVAPGMQVRRAG